MVCGPNKEALGRDRRDGMASQSKELIFALDKSFVRKKEGVAKIESDLKLVLKAQQDAALG